MFEGVILAFECVQMLAFEGVQMAVFKGVSPELESG
jgi:hypothetical protein